MDIKNFVIHGIEKEQHKNINDYFERDELIPFDSDKINKFLDKLRERYNKHSPSYGQLNKDEDANFTKHLEEFRNGDIDFLNFSIKVVRLIRTEMDKAQAASGGLVVFLEYKFQGKNYILISMLKEKDTMSFNSVDKNLEEITHVDLDKLNEGARISIEDYVANNQPYLSFIKKSQSVKITEYFIDALNCLDYTDSKQYTEIVLDALQRFSKHKEWEKPKYYTARKALFDYFEEARTKKKDGSGDGMISLSVLSTAINMTEPDEFLNFITADESIKIAHNFEPHRDTYLKIKRLRGKDGDVTFSFDKADIDSGKVRFDPVTKQLTILISKPDLINDLTEFNPKHATSSDQST